MLRKTFMAAIAAASLGVALAGLSTSASAEWGGPHRGWDQHRGHGYGYGPPPWVKRWHWRHRHWAPPHRGPHPGYSYGRPVPPRSHW